MGLNVEFPLSLNVGLVALSVTTPRARANRRRTHLMSPGQRHRELVPWIMSYRVSPYERRSRLSRCPSSLEAYLRVSLRRRGLPHRTPLQESNSTSAPVIAAGFSSQSHRASDPNALAARSRGTSIHASSPRRHGPEPAFRAARAPERHDQSGLRCCSPFMHGPRPRTGPWPR